MDQIKRQPRNERVTLRLTEDELNAFAGAASTEQRSLSDVIRIMAWRWLKDGSTRKEGIMRITQAQ